MSECTIGDEREAMELREELRALRAQLEAVTRERDALLDERRLVALELGCGLRVPLPGRLADVAAHFVAQVRIGEARLTRERDEAQAVLRKCHEVAWPRGGDLNGDPVCDLMLMRGTFQAHITTLERERDEARADAARLREALENIDGAWKGELDDEMSMEQVQAFIAETLRAALASAPSAEPTTRDMRVAEAVRKACVETADASDEASRRVAGDLRDLDLAAVVAKAAKAVKP